MVDIALSDKQMKPGVIHTDQFENGVHILRFTIPDYMQNNVDLRKFKAYVVTSIKGVMDVTEIPYTISSRQVILTWNLSAYTLKEPGIIQFQIKFASSEKDGAAVWMSYKGVVINRVSINAEDPTSANYPTLMKQWLDLMHTLSGVYGTAIEYMMPGESIPIDERLDGRLYYQWLEVPNRRALCATGTVNLGKRPYADSGLYINNKHICVDTNDVAAYVLDADAWVNAVNAADCGVIATDISSDGEIILLLTAKNAGKSGNSITIQLTTATYGSGAGMTNPSDGHLSGSTLVGGADATTGESNPTGQLEDANGNIISKLGAKYLANADLNKIVEHGEYICAGTMMNNPVSGNTYCMLRVTDSSSTSRIIQECFCVNMGDNSVRTFVRAVVGGSEFGAWRELVDVNKITQLQDRIKSISMVPDYSKAIGVTSPYTAPSNGYLVVNGGYEQNLNVVVNGMVTYHTHSAGSYGYENATIPLAKSDSASFNCLTAYFVPCK